MAEQNGRARQEAEEWYDPAFLNRLRALFLRLRKRRHAAKRRLPLSAAPTREFKDYRAYSINDDFRSVDWRVYARLGRLFVRLFEPVQEFQVYLLVDTSSSMDRPYVQKRNNMLRLAVALGYLALVGHHRVSVLTMKDRIVTALPSLKGQGSIHRLINVLRKLEFGGATDLPACFKAFRPAPQHHAVTFVLSDLLGHAPGVTGQALRRVGSWPGDTQVIQILHPQEREPEWEGVLRLTDAETGEESRMRLTKADWQRYRELFGDFLQSIEKACVSRQVDYQLWMADRDFEDFFTALLDRGSVLGRRD